MVGSVLTFPTNLQQIKQPMTCGVLGPLLFLLYINDIHRSSAKLAFYLFADDTNLLYADKNLRTLELVVNSELHKVMNG